MFKLNQKCNWPKNHVIRLCGTMFQLFLFSKVDVGGCYGGGGWGIFRPSSANPCKPVPQ